MATPKDERNEVKVLLVDDDEDDYALTRDLLADISGGNYKLEWISDFDKGIIGVCSGCYDVVLLDYKLGAKTGIELLTEARQLGCEAPVIILTGMTDHEIDLAAMKLGAADYLEKTQLDRTVLDRTIRYAMRQKQIEAELERRVKDRTAELDDANAALRDADRRKDEFLATLAHELRNPLAPIRNAIEIMRLAEDKPETVAAARGMLDRQVGQLVRLIDDLLDVSRITRGKLRLQIENLTLNEVLDAAVEQSRPLLNKAGHELTMHVPPEPIRLNGDRVRLSQVFTNLLNNAAKYSDPGGGVLLMAERDGDRALVRVRDTGVGIPEDMLPHIFEPFTQVDRHLHRAQGGLGIGLSLVRRLLEMHDATVTAHSDGPGQGAEFVVNLPCSK